MPMLNPSLVSTSRPPVMEARRWIEGVSFPPERPLLNLSQAAPVATADLTTCSSEDRRAARSDQFIPSRYAARAAAARDRAPRPRRAQTP